MKNSQKFNLLDRESQRRNPSSYRSYFRKMVIQNRKQALLQINDDKLEFPSLYLLIQEIIDLDLLFDLNTKNMTALKTYANIFPKQALSHKLSFYLVKEGPFEHQVLKWMFKTGHIWDGPDHDFDDYDALIDAIAAILIRKYRDKSILPKVVALIFQRNRNDLFIHNLVWSFFQSFDPNSIEMLIPYLLSANHKDRDLASKLLHVDFINNDGQRVAQSYRSWIAENKPYLFFTGEHFQSTSNPNPLAVDLEAKYFAKQVSPRQKKPLLPYTSDELQSLEVFHCLSSEEKEMLASHSHWLHKKNLYLWKQWMKNSIDTQILLLKERMKHPNDHN